MSLAEECHVGVVAHIAELLDGLAVDDAVVEDSLVVLGGGNEKPGGRVFVESHRIDLEDHLNSAELLVGVLVEDQLDLAILESLHEVVDDFLLSIWDPSSVAARILLQGLGAAKGTKGLVGSKRHLLGLVNSNFYVSYDHFGIDRWRDLTFSISIASSRRANSARGFLCLCCSISNAAILRKVALRSGLNGLES